MQLATLSQEVLMLVGKKYRAYSKGETDPSDFSLQIHRDVLWARGNGFVPRTTQQPEIDFIDVSAESETFAAPRCHIHQPCRIEVLVFRVLLGPLKTPFRELRCTPVIGRDFWWEFCIHRHFAQSGTGAL
jgi:hypothetical protein